MQNQKGDEEMTLTDRAEAFIWGMFLGAFIVMLGRLL